jgi:hypothetical protein
MADIKQALKDFVATSNSGKYTDENELLSKFPELEGFDVQALKDFVATSNSGKYKSEDELFSKFPEFSISEQPIKKKGSMESSLEDGSSDLEKDKIVEQPKRKPITGEELAALGTDAPTQQPKLPPVSDATKAFAREQPKGRQTSFLTPAETTETQTEFTQQPTPPLTEQDLFEKREELIEQSQFERNLKSPIRVKTPQIEPIELSPPTKAPEGYKLEGEFIRRVYGTINNELLKASEEFIAPKLNDILGDYGYTVEETAIGRDRVKVTAPNGKSIEIDRHAKQFTKEEQEAAFREVKRLHTFLETNAPSRDKQYLVEKAYPSNARVILSETDLETRNKDFSERVVSISTDYTKLSEEKADIDNRANNLESEILNFNNVFVKDLQSRVSSGKYTPQQANALLKQEQARLQAKQDELLSESEQIRSRYEELENRKQELVKDESRLNQSLGRYATMKAQQGSWAGGVWNSLLSGAGGVASGLIDMGINLATATNTDSVIKDFDRKQMKSPIVEPVRNWLKENKGDKYTTPEWSDLRKKDFWGGAVLGLVESIPAMVMPGGWAAKTAAFFGLTTDFLNQEMEGNPEFDNITEDEKMLIQIPVGITVAILEQYGLRNIVESKGLLNNLILKVLGKSATKSSAKTFAELLENEIENMVTRGILKVGGGALSEFETGLLQEVADLSAKQIYNLAKGKEMFDTPEDIWDAIGQVVKGGLQEAVGGGLMTSAVAVSTATRTNSISKLSDTEFEIFEKAATDQKVMSAYIQNIKNRIVKGELTQQEGEAELDYFNKTVSAYRAIPDDLSLEDRRNSLDLISKKRILELRIEGKEPSLVEYEKREIERIEGELKRISETKNQTNEETKTEEVGDEVGTAEDKNIIPEQTEVSEASEEVAATETEGVAEEVEATTEDKAKKAEIEKIESKRKADLELRLSDLESIELKYGVKGYPATFEAINAKYDAELNALEQNQPTEQTDEATAEPDALQSEIDATAKALEGVKFNANFNLPLEQTRSAAQVAEAYHAAKKDGNNPELVAAVEELLGAKEAPKVAETTETTEQVEQQGAAEASGEKVSKKKSENVVKPKSDTKKVEPKVEPKQKKAVRKSAVEKALEKAKAKIDPANNKLSKKEFKERITEEIVGNEKIIKIDDLIVHRQPKGVRTDLAKAYSNYSKGFESAEVKAKKKNKLQENIAKKWSKIEATIPSDWLALFFLNNNKMSSAEAVAISGYPAKDLKGMVSENGLTVTELTERISEELGLDDLSDIEVRELVSEYLERGIESIRQEYNDRLELQEVEYGTEAYMELMGINIDEMMAEQAAEITDDLLDKELTDKERTELDAIIADNINEDGSVNYDKISNDIINEINETKEPYGKETTERTAKEDKKGDTSKTDSSKNAAKEELSSAKKEFADKLRNLKIDTKGKLYGGLAPLGIGLYNTAVEMVALSVEGGMKLSNAIAKAMKYIDSKMQGKKWDKGLFAKEMNIRYSVTLSDGRKVEVERDTSREAAEVINGWYQPIEQKILNTKQATQPANKWAEQLRSKEDEDLWTGVREYLESKGTESVSKKELLDFMKDNRVEIVEVVKGGKPKLEWDENINIETKQTGSIKSKDGFYEIEKDFEGYNVYRGNGIVAQRLKTLNEAKQAALDFDLEVSENKQSTDTKFSQYQLEGGKENYKEVLVIMPNERSKIAQRRSELAALDRERPLTESEQKEYDNLQQRLKKDEGVFKSSHFDEPNILVHLRMNTRTDAQGNKVLFLEEVQSDWGQEGKKKGFKDTKKEQRFKKADYKAQKVKGNEAFIDVINKETGGNFGSYLVSEVGNEEGALNRFIEERNEAFMDKEERERISPAPFVTETPSWVKLGLKTALKEAVAQGEQMQRTAFEKLVDEKMDWVEARMKKLGKLEVKCP